MILAALVLAAEVYFIVGRAVGLPRTPLTADSFLDDNLAKGHRVSQTMKIEAGGFNEIRLRASPLGATRSGEVTLALYEVPRDESEIDLWRGRSRATGVNIMGELIMEGEEQLVYQDVIPASIAVSEPTFAFRFPVIDESAGRSYRLDIQMSEPNPQNGIGLWATDGRWSGDGSMFINDQSAYAELVFETQATRATTWARLRYHVRGLRLVGLIMFAICAHLVLFAILYALMTMGVEPRARVRSGKADGILES